MLHYTLVHHTYIIEGASVWDADERRPTIHAICNWLATRSVETGKFNLEQVQYFLLQSRAHGHGTNQMVHYISCCYWPATCADCKKANSSWNVSTAASQGSKEYWWTLQLDIAKRSQKKNNYLVVCAFNNHNVVVLCDTESDVVAALPTSFNFLGRLWLHAQRIDVFSSKDVEVIRSTCIHHLFHITWALYMTL